MTIIVESGLKTKLMDLGHIYTVMELNMLVNGILISNTGKEKKPGLMEQNTQAIIQEAKSMARVNLTGLTSLVMREPSQRIISRDM